MRDPDLLEHPQDLLRGADQIAGHRRADLAGSVLGHPILGQLAGVLRVREQSQPRRPWHQLLEHLDPLGRQLLGHERDPRHVAPGPAQAVSEPREVGREAIDVAAEPEKRIVRRPWPLYRDGEVRGVAPPERIQASIDASGTDSPGALAVVVTLPTAWSPWTASQKAPQPEIA
jgi:hypothetical protein